MNRKKLCLIGSSYFTVFVYDNLVKFFDINQISTIHPKMYGRHENEIKDNPFAHHLKAKGVTNILYSLDEIDWNGSDIYLVASYSKIIKSRFIQNSNHPMINFHVSLLPDLRGAIPVQMAIYKGYEYIGTSIIKITDGLDEGDILIQNKFELNKEYNTEDVFKQSAEMLSLGLYNSMDNYFNDIFIKQDGNVSYAKLKDLEIIRGEQPDLKHIYRSYLALSPYDTLHLELLGRELELVSVKLLDINEFNQTLINLKEINLNKSYSLFFNKNHVYLLEKDFVIELLEVKPIGKRNLSPIEYINGYIKTEKHI